MRKLVLALAIVLMTSIRCFAQCDSSIDGYEYCHLDISDYNGISPAPSVSSIGQARVYFDLSSGKLKCSENGGAYANCVGSGSSGGGATVSAGTYLAADLTFNSAGTITYAARGQLTSLSDVGSSTKTAGNYLVADGANFQSVSMTGDITQTSAGVTAIGSSKVGATQITSTSVTSGSYNAANLTVDGDGRLTFAARGQLTSLSDISTSTKTAGNILVADGTNFGSVAVSSACTLTSAGVLSCTRDVGGVINAPTSSLTIPGPKYTNNATWNSGECWVDSGTSAVLTIKQCNGSGASCAAVTNPITCLTTSTAFTFTGAGALTAGNDLQQSVGTVTGSVNNLRWTASQTQ